MLAFLLLPGFSFAQWSHLWPRPSTRRWTLARRCFVGALDQLMECVKAKSGDSPAERSKARDLTIWKQQQLSAPASTSLYQHEDYFHKLQVGGTVSFQQVTRSIRNDFRSATAVTASRIPYPGLVGLCLLQEKCWSLRKTPSKIVSGIPRNGWGSWAGNCRC